MPSVLITGAQWGDECKGKIVDLLSCEADIIVRSLGGGSSGHTVIRGKAQCRLRFIPSAIFHPSVQCFLGAGMVIDPATLLEEIQTLDRMGVSLEERLSISPRAHVIFPYHRHLDRLLEERKGSRNIGTTGRGIGPCYADKVNRIGLQVGEWIHPERFVDAIRSVLPIKNEELTKIYGKAPLKEDELIQEYSYYAQMLKPYVREIESTLFTEIRSGSNVILEGAQGTFLDITMGMYPYVTSSPTLAAGICAGAGIGCRDVHHAMGVVKAYTTRLGKGPFPTECTPDQNFICVLPQIFKENQMKRFGWFDAVVARTAVRLNGLNSLAVTKLEVLDGIQTLKICVGYELDGQAIDTIPPHAEDFEKVQPIYEEFPGWTSPLSGVSSFSSLPRQAQAYLERIEQLCGVPLSIVTTGPERFNAIILQNPFIKQESLSYAN